MTRTVSNEELAVQRGYIYEIRDLIPTRYESQPLAFVDTYGCQQNEADSEKIRGMLRDMGYGFTQDEAKADVIVINTCAVREHAQQRVLGNVGALVHTKRAKKEQIIAVCGCMAQQPSVVETIKKSYVHVDMVFGPHELWRFPELLLRRMKVKKRIFLSEPSDGVLCEGLPSLRKEGVKAWLPIMQGCNNFCSYCIVPYVRGREISRTPNAVLAEARELIALGKKEINLLGQNVNSYDGDGVDFPELLRRCSELEGDFILRYMTSHPKDASEKLFEVMASSDKIAKHIHLPFQCGNDRVLKVMNRHYDRARYLDLIKTARKYMPDLVLTSDVIVGFPGETEEEFEDTMSLVRQVEFDSLFIFIYSPRIGTPAAKMDDPYTHAQKVERLKRLTALQDEISAKKNAACVQKTFRVLVDGFAEGSEYKYTARTSGNRLVHLNGPDGLIGSFVNAKITADSSWCLYGEVTH